MKFNIVRADVIHKKRRKKIITEEYKNQRFSRNINPERMNAMFTFSFCHSQSVHTPLVPWF